MVKLLTEKVNGVILIEDAWQFMYAIKKLWMPQIYQGKFKRRNYFEGWYYKLIDKYQEQVYAVIPGVSFGSNPGDSHAFVQVIDAQNCEVFYFNYDISYFRYSKDSFEVFVKDNYFRSDRISLDLKNESITINGTLDFSDIVHLPKSFLNPGIMGPFSFVPFMECYHGIVNIHHNIKGSILIDDRRVDFNDGYGYIEKDWGRSFPEAWVWIQCNHFDSKDVSIMFSVAKIPWFGSHFTGFIAFLRVEDRIYRFATYTRAQIKFIKYSSTEVDVAMEDKRYSMRIKAFHSNGGMLRAPKNGSMNRTILESISGKVNVQLLDRNDKLIFKGEGTNAGIEIMEGI